MLSPDFRTYSVKIPSPGLGYPVSNLSHLRTSCLTIIYYFIQNCNRYSKIYTMNFYELSSLLLCYLHKTDTPAHHLQTFPTDSSGFPFRLI